MYPFGNYYMVFFQKDFLIQMRYWIIGAATVASIWPDIPTYADEQIISLLKQHLNTIDQGPTYLGQSIYEDNNQRVFQLEIGSSKERINEHLLYSFEALARIGSYASTPYKLFVLIIHIDKYDIPIIAHSKFTCCKAFYVDGTMTEKKWRDECLLMKAL